MNRRGFVKAVALSALGACGHRPWEDPSGAWRQVTSQHFVVQTDAGASAYLPLVDRLEDVHLALSATFFTDMQTEPIQVLYLDRTRDFEAMAPKDTGGFAILRTDPTRSQRLRLLVFPAASEFDLVASTAAHEVAHAFLHGLGAGVPSWLHEGFAKYVGALHLEGDLVIFDNGEIHGGYAWFANPVPLAQLFLATTPDFHGSGQLAHYMTAWFLVRMLLNAPGPNPAQRIRTLAQQLSQPHDVATTVTVVERAFGGTPLATIEASLVESHRLIVSGIGKPVMRKTLAKTLVRGQRTPPRVEPGDREAIKALCFQLRATFT